MTPSQGVDFLARLADQEAAQEAQLSATKKLRSELETNVLVELFDRYEHVNVQTTSGNRAERKLWVTGSLPKVGEKDTPEEAIRNRARREEAIRLASEEYEWNPFIKTSITIEFDKGDRQKALDLYAKLRREDNSAEIAIDETIHPMTLQAQVRRRLREGKDVKLETLGITALSQVKLKK